nr:hypothetical protein [uncultured Amphritea sp.]
MAQLSPAALNWLQQFSDIEHLQQAIFAALKKHSIDQQTVDSPDDEAEFVDLVKQQDQLIRRLPFDQLNAEDVSQLQDKITQLQQHHQTLTQAINHQKQRLLNQSSQSKKAGRSIKAYQQAQDL